MKKPIFLLSFLLLALTGFTKTNPETKDAAPAITVAPTYAGGTDLLYKHISAGLTYPKLAQLDMVEGEVTVRFTVDADGSVKNAVVPAGKGIGHGCDEEAIRVVMSLSSFQPGTKNGTAVPVQYEIPIKFALNKVKF